MGDNDTVGEEAVSQSVSSGKYGAWTKSAAWPPGTRVGPPSRPGVDESGPPACDLSRWVGVDNREFDDAIVGVACEAGGFDVHDSEWCLAKPWIA